MAAFLILFMAIKLVRMQLQVQADATDEETGESHEAPRHMQIVPRARKTGMPELPSQLPNRVAAVAR